MLQVGTTGIEEEEEIFHWLSSAAKYVHFARHPMT
jgi:hypothetical protein